MNKLDLERLEKGWTKKIYKGIVVWIMNNGYCFTDSLNGTYFKSFKTIKAEIDTWDIGE